MTKYVGFDSLTEREPPTSASRIPLVIRKRFSCSTVIDVGCPTTVSNGAGSSCNGAPRFPNFFTGRSRHFAWSTGVPVRSHLPGTGRKRLQIPCAATALEQRIVKARLNSNGCGMISVHPPFSSAKARSVLFSISSRGFARKWAYTLSVQPLCALWFIITQKKQPQRHRAHRGCTEKKPNRDSR